MKVAKISLTGVALLSLLAVLQQPGMAFPLGTVASEAQQDLESLDRVGFMPGGWDRNDLRTDVDKYSAAAGQSHSDQVQAVKEESLDRAQFRPGGWDGNDLRTDVDKYSAAAGQRDSNQAQAVKEESLDRAQFMPGGWDHNDLRTDAPWGQTGACLKYIRLPRAGNVF